MTRNCQVCGTPAVWQGMLNPRWVHTDAAQEADHAAIYIQPAPLACCNQDAVS